jgi:hypothetical protein
VSRRKQLSKAAALALSWLTTYPGDKRPLEERAAYAQTLLADAIRNYGRNADFERAKVMGVIE